MFNDIWSDLYSEDLFFTKTISLGAGFTGSRWHHRLTKEKVRNWRQEFANKSVTCMEQHKGPNYIKHSTIDVNLLGNYQDTIKIVDDNIHHFGVHTYDYWDNELFTQQFKNIFDIDCLTVSRINCSVPGSTTYNHLDYELHIFKKYVKIMLDIKNKQVGHCLIFLEDQQPEQTFYFGDQQIEWIAGDAFLFPWYMPHGGENKSEYYRYAAHLTTFDGVKL